MLVREEWKHPAGDTAAPGACAGGRLGETMTKHQDLFCLHNLLTFDLCSVSLQTDHGSVYHLSKQSILPIIVQTNSGLHPPDCLSAAFNVLYVTFQYCYRGI